MTETFSASVAMNWVASRFFIPLLLGCKREVFYQFQSVVAKLTTLRAPSPLQYNPLYLKSDIPILRRVPGSVWSTTHLFIMRETSARNPLHPATRSTDKMLSC